ncbi:SWI/SNF chromatin-remodeling complex subunit snf5 [Rhizoctonia solani]|uniref:SWI/SNF chromatin-remodeling complex subunit snf5 n=1 Tax=Rhizoctonia solani TaxID=456999 RepID=A0A0K6G0T2_9AGAM|nr:SWI/SNF chromatin-remodeling complex subunit snf5 [Rhizoctonia solani]
MARLRRIPDCSLWNVDSSARAVGADLAGIDIDHDHFRLRDTFTWNPNDPISSNSVVQAVAKSIIMQLQEHRAHIVEPMSGPRHEEVRGEKSEADQKWWAKCRRREDVDQPEVEIEEKDKETNEELRVLVMVGMIVGTMNRTDHFEWGINDPRDSLEEFAEVYCKELRLSGEFKTAVAHSNHEQVSVYQKSLFLVRIQAEIKRNERERERELKRKRRQTRGRRGIVLLDRDLQKTHRTAIGYAEIEPSPAQQAVQQPAPVTYRRAPAGAASLTIANLAAENGTSPVQTPMHIPERPPVMMHHQQQQQQQQQVPPPQPPKQKRQRTGILQPATSTSSEPYLHFPTPTGEEDGQQAMLKCVLEKEGAESAEGLHPNMIDGTWHCSNCGCPESISVGRRKGPLGQGTMCGECGKFWHKHGKPRPVEYTTSIESHVNLKKIAKLKKRGGKASLNPNPSPFKPPSGTRLAIALSATPKATGSGVTRFHDRTGQSKSRAAGAIASPPVEEQKPAASPTPAPAASDEPPQSAAPAEANGRSTTPPAGSPQSQVSAQTRDPSQEPTRAKRLRSDSSVSTVPERPYTPGPDQTLTNFEVHLKNRAHRANVNKRVLAEAAAAGLPPPDLRRITPQATPAPASSQAAPTPTQGPEPSN